MPDARLLGDGARLRAPGSGLRSADRRASAILALGVVFTAVPSPAAASALDREVAALVEGLELSRLGAPIEGEVLVSVTLDPAADGELPRLVSGLTVGALETAGIGHARDLEGDGRTDAELADLARDQGAEWLLVVRGGLVTDPALGPAKATGRGTLRLSASLLEVDRGLWAPRWDGPRLAATSVRDAPLDDTLRALLGVRALEPERAEATSAHLAAPVMLGAIDDRVLALASCPAAAPGLFALVGRALVLFARERAGLPRVAALDLTREPRKREPAREPIGALSCAGAEVLVAHGELASGYAVRAARGAGGEVALQVTRTLPGFPFGQLGGRVVLADLDHGRARFAPALRVLDGAKTTERALDGPALDVAVDDALPPPLQVAIVSADYHLTAVPEGGAQERLGASGVAPKIFLHAGRVLAVVTSSIARADRDRLELLDVGVRPALALDALDLDGSAYATALAGPVEARELVVAAWRRALRRTDILAVPIRLGRATGAPPEQAPELPPRGSRRSSGAPQGASTRAGSTGGAK